MKNLKLFLLALGAVAVIVAAVMLFMAVKVDLKVIWEIATRYQGGGTSNNLVDPRPKILIITGIALGAGVCLGLGLALPLRRAPSQKQLDSLVDERVEQRLHPTPQQPTTQEEEAS